MNLRFVSSFIATAELGSFAKAAESLFSTQATIASRVARLEEELGVPLFFRDGSTLVLTEHGHAALPLARQLLASAEEMMHAANKPGAGQGVFRLAWTDYASHLFQPDLLRAASRHFPQLDFEFSTLSSMDVMDRLHNGRIDVGILVGAEAKPNLVSQHLFDLPLRWICKTDVVGSDGTRSLDFLGNVPLLAYPVGTIPAQAVDAQLDRAGLRPPQTFRLDTLHAVIANVRAGTGLALIPPLILKAEIEAGSLQVLDIPTPLETLRFHAHFRRNARSKICDYCCDLIRKLAVRALDSERGTVANDNVC